MSESSLARRIFRSIFAIGAINVAVTMVAIEFIYEDVEDTILRLELAEERNFLEQRIKGSQVQSWNSALLTALYVPDGQTAENMHPLFINRPIPFSAEVLDGEKSFLLSIDRTESPPGVLYLAQDISILEDREDFMQLAVAFLGAGMLLLGFLLARHGTRRVVKPLEALTGDIRSIEPGTRINRIESAYEEMELADIANTLNDLLGALDEYVKREKSLVSLASHELRTPIAVIAGALDVLEQRASLSAADQRTLSRIRRATDEMRSDVDVLLKLARRHGNEDEPTRIELTACVDEVICDIEACSLDTSRHITSAAPAAPVHVVADPALVRMLLRNLIQNAVRHTRDEVHVDITPEHLLIRDHGDGLPQSAQARLTAPAAHQSVPENGLGLFIVRLICERLGWRIAIRSDNAAGTVIELHFDQSNAA